MIIDVLLSWCASCSPLERQIVNTGAGFVAGAMAFGGSLGALDLALSGSSATAEIGDPTGSFIEGSQFDSTPHGFRANASAGKYTGNRGGFGETVDGPNVLVEAGEYKPGAYGLGLGATAVGHSFSYGSASGDATTNGDVYVSGGVSAGAGAEAHYYQGSDVDGDGLPEFGIGGSVGPWTGDLRVEVPFAPPPPPPPPPGQWAPPPTPSFATTSAGVREAPSLPPAAPTPPAAPAPPRPTPVPDSPQSIADNPSKVEPPAQTAPPAHAPAPDAGDSSSDVPRPKPTHDVRVQMGDGGYRIDHPDGTSDIHWHDGSVVHVEADGVTWHQVRPAS